MRGAKQGIMLEDALYVLMMCNTRTVPREKYETVLKLYKHVCTIAHVQSVKESNTQMTQPYWLQMIPRSRKHRSHCA